MTLETFWKIIAEARHSNARASDIPDWLVQHLSQYPEPEIIGFHLRLRECLHGSYDAQLWLGAVILLGGCSDDSFEYFRAWLIAQGKELFDEALRDTDSLASIEDFDGEYGVPRLEGLLATPLKAFLKHAGGEEFSARDRFERLLPPNHHPALRNQELTNTRDEDIRALLPKLTARFPTPIRSRRER
jgi:hypothetical protein